MVNNSLIRSLIRPDYLEDHPQLGKWLITMVSKSPKNQVVPLPNGL